MSYNCDACKKEYSSYQSLWNHNKRFHKTDPLKTEGNQPNPDDLPPISEGQFYLCNHCSKKYTRKDNLKRHFDKCDEKHTIENMKKKMEELQKQICEMQNKSNQSNPSNVNNITNQTNNNAPVNNTNTTVNNNGTINNINNVFVKFGSIKYNKILSKGEIKRIINKQRLSLEEGIKTVHFNKKHPEYNNFFITNLKDDIAYIFDGKNFISVDKNEMLSQLIDMHSDEISVSLEQNKKEIKPSFIPRIENFLKSLNNDKKKFKDETTNKTYSNFKACKIHSLKKMVYNESDTKKLKQLNNMDLEEKVILDTEEEEETNHNNANSIT
jgi:gas vesicle protein